MRDKMQMHIVRYRPIYHAVNGLFLSCVIIPSNPKAHQGVDDKLIAAVFRAGIVEDFQQPIDGRLADLLVKQQSRIEERKNFADERFNWPVYTARLLHHALEGPFWFHFE